jgi:uncharacterized protein (TIGR02284 family)
MTSSSGSALENPSISRSEVEQVLRSVMQSLTDSEEGFWELGEEVKDPSLRRYFLEESSMRTQFRSELEAVLLQEGFDDTRERGTVAGALNRAWGQFKSALGGSDHTLLVTAEKGEDQMMEAYRKAFEKELPYPVQQLFAAQAGHVEASHNYIRAARDSST